MKVLFVFSGNSTKVSTFISEQRLSLEKKGVQIDYFPISGKGLTGYLKNLPNLINSFLIFNFCEEKCVLLSENLENVFFLTILPCI